jgi:hypothetical protein
MFHISITFRNELLLQPSLDELFNIYRVQYLVKVTSNL